MCLHWIIGDIFNSSGGSKFDHWVKFLGKIGEAVFEGERWKDGLQKGMNRYLRV